jgi:trigger factor
MQVIETKKDGLAVDFKVTVDATEITNKVDQKLKDIAKRIDLPGFRKGNVSPKVIDMKYKVVKDRYNDTARSEVLEDVINNTTTQLLKERNLTPAFKPKVDIISFEENNGLEYSISMEVFPEINIPEFSKFTLEKLVCEVTDKDLNEALEDLAKRNKKFNEAKETAKAKLGDALLIDAEGIIDDKPFEGGKVESFQLELGSKTFIEGFEDQLIGAKAGDKKTVKVRFPDNYHSTEVAGKDAVFNVEVKKVLNAETPEINEEFAKNFGLNSVDELKTKLKEQLEKDLDVLSSTILKKALFDTLDKECDYPVPQGMVDNEYNIISNQAKRLKDANSESTNEKSEEEMNKEFYRLAERRVKLGLFLSEVGKHNKVNIDQNELRQAIYDQARSYPGQEHAIIDFYRKTPAALESLKGPILEEKVVKLIIEQVKLKEKKISKKELLKLSEVASEEDDLS